MLRDRYYLGYVVYDGQEYEGRHEALVSRDLFDRVQVILESRTAAQERRRIHHHYLKGSMFCGRCHRAGRRGRLIIQRAINSRGSEYMYFFCRNKQDSTCDSRYVNILHVEMRSSSTTPIQFSPQFVAEVRSQLGEILAGENASARLLRRQLTTELHGLDARENNLLALGYEDLTASAKEKIKIELQKVELQRERLTERLGQTQDDLALSAELIKTCVSLLQDPQALYLRCDDSQRRLLNQALFTSLYLEEDQVIDADMVEPFGQLHALQEASEAAERSQSGACPQDAERAVREENGPSVSYSLEELLRGVARGTCSSSPSMVDLSRTYHKRPDLASVLVKRVGRLRKAQAAAPRPRRSVRSTGRAGQDWRVGDRLSADDVRRLVAAFGRGTPKWQLAEQYGISESSVKRLLRRHRQVAEGST